MIDVIGVDESFGLADYETLAPLTNAVRELRTEAAVLAPRLQGRQVWMVNSTAQGGGVAEMLPKMISLLRELGVSTQWAVIGTDRMPFFDLTKRIHNLIHGVGTPELTDGDRKLYEAVNRTCADELRDQLSPNDLLVVHDPQPMAMGWMLKKELELPTIWRCHIGLDQHLPQTRTAWKFLERYAEGYDQSVLSAPEYIPDYLAGHSTIIHPALDPCSHKNRVLSPHKLVGVLCNAGLKQERSPVLTPAFEHRVQRLQPDGSFAPANANGEIGLLYRPIVTQISRWDRLKGFGPLLEAFVLLKKRLADADRRYDDRHRRRLDILRLVLAGPDPASIQDDPEGREVLEDLCKAYRALPPEIQQDVALLTLPMDSRKENALMVNALQRCSTIIVQNSLQEGFGLTATEAMWKSVPVLGSQACGMRQQVRDGVDGVLNPSPQDPLSIADRLDYLLADSVSRDRMARSGERRVHEMFLIFTQLANWLRLMAACADGSPLPR